MKTLVFLIILMMNSTAIYPQRIKGGIYTNAGLDPFQRLNLMKNGSSLRTITHRTITRIIGKWHYRNDTIVVIESIIYKGEFSKVQPTSDTMLYEVFNASNIRQLRSGMRFRLETDSIKRKGKKIKVQSSW